MSYLLGSGIKFLIFIIVLPLVGWAAYRIVDKKKEKASIIDPEVIFPTILITAVMVKIIHTVLKSVIN